MFDLELCDVAIPNDPSTFGIANYYENNIGEVVIKNISYIDWMLSIVSVQCRSLLSLDDGI